MKRVLSVMVAGALVLGAGVASAASAEVCARYAEADHAYDLAVQEARAVAFGPAVQAAKDVALAAVREASAAYQAVLREGGAAKVRAGEVMNNAMSAAGRQRNAAYDAADVAYTAAIEAAQAAYETETGVISYDEYGNPTIPYDEEHRIKDAAAQKRIRARQEADAARVEAWRVADKAFNRASQTAYAVRRAVNEDVDNAVAAAVETELSERRAAEAVYRPVEQAAQAAYDVAEQQAKVVRGNAYLDIYEAADGARSDVPAVMAKLRTNHRQRCRVLYGL